MNIKGKRMNRQTILITGASGFVGSSFVSHVKQKNLKFDMLLPTHKQLDVSKAQSVDRYIKKNNPSIIINFAAHRNANTAEEQRNNKKGTAWKANVDGTKNLVSVAKKKGIYTIHISTDMVFSGHSRDKGPYSEIQNPKKNPYRLSWYGWTKLLAEREVQSYDGAAVIRIGNVTKPIYDPALDYVGKILWLHDQKKLYSLFDDQFITLSYLPDLGRAIVTLIKNKISGVFHVASGDLLTPFDMAEYLLFKTRKEKSVVKRTSIDEFLKKVPNRYPKYGGLKSVKTQEKLGLKFESWREIVDNFIKYVDNTKGK